jgi:hypothetical protein
MISANCRAVISVVADKAVERVVTQPIDPRRIREQRPSEGDDVELAGLVLLEQPVDGRGRHKVTRLARAVRSLKSDRPHRDNR